MTDAVLRAVLDEAVAATRSRTGLVVEVRGAELRVRATSGPVPASLVVGSVVPSAGVRGHAVASGQPAALVPSADDASNAGIGGSAATPANLLVAPGGDAVLVEVADRDAGGAYTFDDIEAVASYASIAAAALDDAEAGETVIPPARLGAELTALAQADPGRYRDVARVVEALLAAGR